MTRMGRGVERKALNSPYACGHLPAVPAVLFSCGAALFLLGLAVWIYQPLPTQQVVGAARGNRFVRQRTPDQTFATLFHGEVSYASAWNISFASQPPLPGWA